MWIKRVTPWRCAASATRRGALDVNGAISLCGRLGQNAHEVDDRIRSRDCSADSDVVKHVGLDELWCLARSSRHLDTTGMAYGYAHRLAISEKQRHEMAPNEAGSAEHRDAAGHRLPPWHLCLRGNRLRHASHAPRLL
jgi:hypothetical protein